MIKELCNRHGINCVYTSKLFFDRYTSSITVVFPEDVRSEYDVTVTEIHKLYRDKDAALKEANQNFNLARTSYINDLFARFDMPDDASYRMNKVSVTFYHDNPSDMAAIIEALRGQVAKVTVPRNESEIAFLRMNTDKLLLDRYFMNRYRYRVTFKDMVDHNPVQAHLENQFGTGDGQIDGDRAYYYQIGLTSHLYITDFDDLFLTKIGLQYAINKVDEVVLRSE